MPPLKFTEVLSFSSEDPNHPADNLLRPETFRKWKCAAGSSEKQASVTVKLERLSPIHSVDIGNEGSAFVEVLVAREGVDFQVLLVASSFMTPGESRNGSNLSRVRMFGSDKLNKTVAEQKWDRFKVICTQPFNKNMQYGLSFITVTASSEKSSESTPKGIRLGSFTLKEEEESDPISVGSIFARRKNSESSSPLTGAAAIRAASAAAATTINSSPSMDEAKKKKDFNVPEVGFYQLKKNTGHDLDHTKSPRSSKPAASPSESTSSKPAASLSESTPDKKHLDKNRERDNEKKRKDHEGKYEKDRDKNRKDKYQERNRRPESDKKKEDAEGTKRKHPQEVQQSTATSSAASSKRKSAPFKSLLKDVNFVLSGYQNPQRSQIRDMMIDMGAHYKPDWDPSCTHLICAFANTPKYQQVKGKGRIVTAKWVSDCYKNKIRYPGKRYALDKQSSEDSEEEIWVEELLPKEEKPVSETIKSISKPTTSDNEESIGGNYNDDTYSDNEDTDDEIERALAKRRIKEEHTTTDKNATNTSNKSVEKPPNKKIKVETNEKQKVTTTDSNRKSCGVEDVKKEINGTEDNIYDDDTDIDEENMAYLTRPDTSALPLPSLGDYLHGKCFYIYGNMSSEMKQLLSRYIIAFDGTMEDYMKDTVNFVITNDEWDDHFDDALSDNPLIQFVKPSWIWHCSDKQKLVPFQPFMVVPKE